MRAVVFGGNGFVGRWLLKALTEEKKEVLSCDLQKDSLEKGTPYIQVDIRDLGQVEKIGLNGNDIVVNLAANQYHGVVPREGRREYFFGTNTKGAENILQAAFKGGCRKAIQFTTDMVYGKPQYLPVDEGHRQEPFGPYGESKKEAEKICRLYREKGMDITIFRPRMITGPGRLGILKKLFWLIRHSLPVPTIGSGHNCYQMISVFDCVSAIQCAINHGIPNGEYNLGSKNPPSTRALLQNLISSVGSHSAVVPTPGKLVKGILRFLETIGIDLMYREQYMIADENYILDISKTERELQWEPKYEDKAMIIAAYEEYMVQRSRQQ